MRFLTLNEDENIKKELEDHLNLRGLDLKKTHVLLDDTIGEVFFFLYSLSGKLVGYQKYNSKGVKTSNSNKAEREGILAKYFTWVTKIDRKAELAVYGLET